MSYSFTIRAATAALALAAVAAEMSRVVEAQPPHKADADQAFKNAENMVSLLSEPKEGEEVIVTMSGSLSWGGTAEAMGITSAHASCSAYVGPKPGTPA